MTNEQTGHDVFFVSQAKPNPFRDNSRITYSIPQASAVKIKIYNNLGQEICTLKNENQLAGVYNIEWDGKDKAGRKLASGIYFLSCQAGQDKAIRKLVMTR